MIICLSIGRVHVFSYFLMCLSITSIPSITTLGTFFVVIMLIELLYYGLSFNIDGLCHNIHAIELVDYGNIDEFVELMTFTYFSSLY